MTDLESISKSYGVSVEELKTIEAGLRKKYNISIIPAAELEKYIEQGILQYINRFKDLGLEKYYAVILNASQPQNGVEKRRSEAVKAYNTDPEAAISTGTVQEFKNGIKRFLYKGSILSKPLVAGESVPKTAIYIPDNKVYVVPLDNRATWPSGKKNFGYLKPLPIEQFFMNIEGICSLDATTWLPFKMTYNCEEHTVVPTSKLLQFYAKIKSQNPLTLAYNNKYTKFEQIPGDISVISGSVMGFYDAVPLSEIDATFRAQKSKFDKVAVIGQVINKWQKTPTDDKPFPWMTVTILDNTQNVPFKLLCHPGVNVNFTEQSIIKAWGSLSEGNKWDPEAGGQTEEKEITMFCTGIYPLTVVEEIPEEQDDGWEQ